jgi:uncharacterized Zn finger protein
MPVFSRTWWGERFIAALESFTGAGRLSRGRSYANTGRIGEHTLENGTVTARVRGSINPYFGVYKEPIYTTSITITQYSPAQWTKIVGVIASRADMITRLLQQVMPDRMEEAFEALGLDLLPAGKKDFQTRCSCPDFDNPCKHVAGLCYRVAGDLDRDPFLLFALRGLPRDTLIAELRKSSLGKILASALIAAPPPLEPDASYHTRPTRQTAAAQVSHREFWTGARRLPPAEPAARSPVPAALIKKLGDYPEFWPGNTSFIATMEEIYERVRTKSREMR